MPKRRNPFGDMSPLQFKSHIGKKEIDLGACKDSNMRDVYERTKSMLFEAAKKDTPILTLDCGEMRAEGMEEEISNNVMPGQMYFDSTGKLCTYTGQKYTNNNNNNNHTMESQMGDGRCNGDHSMEVDILPRGQLQIDPSGQLTVGEKVKANRSTPSPCKFCTIPAHIFVKGCSFCDQPVCGNCVRACYRCQRDFCVLCSVINYEECAERSFCLNCAL